jgi:DNA-binding PadR family transcriptional regulator
LTPLNYALLGLVRLQKRSGYALRKEFETTPLGRYSSSPGSIYPALKVLEKAGFLVLRSEADGRSKGLYHLTPAGERALSAWLIAPIDDVETAMLRFAFLEDDDTATILAFLDAFRGHALKEAAALDTFLDGDGAALSAKARLAVLHGRRTLQASADWAVEARSHYLGAGR